MDEFGPSAIRKKREASINVAMRMLAEGEVDSVGSAGNSSAVVAAVRHFVGLLPGLKRPALAVCFPTRGARPILLEAGPHPESGALHLARSAVLAHIYLRVSRGIERPAFCLLNIGSEPAKGAGTARRSDREGAGKTGTDIHRGTPAPKLRGAEKTVRFFFLAIIGAELDIGLSPLLC